MSAKLFSSPLSNAKQLQNEGFTLIFWTLAFIVLGILGHWLYDVLIVGLPTGIFGFGNPAQVVARLIIALFGAVLNFLSVWEQVKVTDPKFRFFTAFTLGWAIDAFTNPLVSVIQASS